MRFVSIIALVLLSSCGYHFYGSEDRKTVSIPYVVGDVEGQLTNEIIHQLSSSGAYEYVRSGGNLTLKVAVVAETMDKIGYRYDRKEFSGKIEKNLMQTENRRNMTAEVTLVDDTTGEIIFGPHNFSSFAEFDYVDVNSLRDLSFINEHGHRVPVLDFSLGQLDSIEGAQDTAITPLYRQLAQKIVMTLSAFCQSKK